MALMGVSTMATQQSSTAQLKLLLKQHQGKVIYLDFWASWCVPCRKSLPWMKQMQQAYSEQGLVIIAVNVDAEPELADAFLAKNPIGFKVVFDPRGVIAQQYQLKGMPSSFLIGRDGELKASHVGFFNNQKPRYQAQIEALLAQSLEEEQ